MEVSACAAEFLQSFVTKPLTCSKQVLLQLALLFHDPVPLVSSCVTGLTVIPVTERDELAPVQDTVQQLVISQNLKQVE